MIQTRTDRGRRRKLAGEDFWPRGYFVSTIGLDEEAVRAYVRRREAEDEQSDQLNYGVYPIRLGRLPLMGAYESLTPLARALLSANFLRTGRVTRWISSW